MRLVGTRDLIPDLNSIETKWNQRHVKLLDIYYKTKGFTKPRSVVIKPQPAKKKLEYGRVIMNFDDPEFEIFKELRPKSTFDGRFSNKKDVSALVQTTLNKDPDLLNSTLKLVDVGINPSSIKLTREI